MRQIWKNLDSISIILRNHLKLQQTLFNWELQGEGVVQINEKSLLENIIICKYFRSVVNFKSRKLFSVRIRYCICISIYQGRQEAQNCNVKFSFRKISVLPK
jgi:hypothetical protein